MSTRAHARAVRILPRIIVALAAASCGDPGPDTTPASVVVTASPATVQSGKTAQLTAVVSNAAGQPISGAVVSYTTSNAAVASVSIAGLVTASQAGTATITATAGSANGSALITVIAGAPASASKITDVPATAIAGSANPIAVRVTDAAGNPVPAVAVTFAATAGGGSITPGNATTDATGIASASYRIGDVVGTNTATATVAGLSPVSFSATGVAGPPAVITKVSADPASVVAGSTFGSEIRVRVRDALGNATAGVNVAFVATAGGGAVSSPTVATDANGEAATQFTTGKTVGVNTATASVGGVSSPASFSITTIAGPPVSVTVPIPVLSVAIGSTLNVNAVAKDVNGNATSGALSFASRATGIATVSTAGVVTGVAAGQSIVAASAGTTGADSVLVIVRPADGPILMTDLGGFSVAANADVAVTILMDMSASAEKLGSTSVTLEWDPAVLIYQSHAATGAGPSPTVSSASATAGRLTLAVADANGYTGKVQMLKVTLKGSGTAGKAGTLKLAASEHTAAVTFVNLLPKTVAVTMPIIIR